MSSNYLVLAPTPTYPADLGSRKGIVAVHNRLRLHGRIHYIFYAAEGEWRDRYDEAALKGMYQQWDTVHVIPPTRPLHTDSVDLDHDVDEWWDDAIGDYLKWRFERSQFDAFIVHYTWLSKALTYAPRAVHRVLYTADRFGGRRELFESRGFRKEFFHLSVEGEATAISRADTVLAVKEQEEEYFRSICNKNIMTVPHHEDRINLQIKPVDKILKIGFIGGFNTINRENFIDFMRDFEQLAAEYFAPVEIIVGGGVCEALRDFQSPLINQVGYIANIEDFYSQVDAVVVPMMWSSGIKIKFAEAVAAGLPTFSTAHASEGYQTTHPWMRCKDFKALSLAIIECSFDSEKLNLLKNASLAAWKFAEDRLNSSVDRLARHIDNWGTKFALVLPKFVGESGSISFEQVWGLFDFIRWNARCDIIIPDECYIASDARRKLQAVANIVSGGDVEHSLASTDCIILVDWSDSISGHVSRVFSGSIITYDIPEPSQFDLIKYFYNHPAETVLCIGDLRGSKWWPLQNAGVRFCDAPIFRRTNLTVAKAWGNQPQYNACIHILSSKKYEKLIKNICEIIKRWNPSVELVIFEAQDYGSQMLVETFSVSTQAGVRPRLVIDFNFNSFSVIREIYVRSAIPVISFEPDWITVELVPELTTSDLATTNISSLLSVIQMALNDLSGFAYYEELARKREAFEFRNDAGWTVIWRFISGLIDMKRIKTL